MPARPTPNFFSAPRRVTDWARPLASSSNSSFISLRSSCPSLRAALITLRETVLLIFVLAAPEVGFLALAIVVCLSTFGATTEGRLLSIAFLRQSQRGQRDSGKSDTEFLQRPAPRDGLGQALG